MSIEFQVRDAVMNGKSGAINLVYIFKDGSESCLSWRDFEIALSNLNAPSSLKRNLDKGVLFPDGREEWQWLETAAENPNFKFKVNTQMASQAIEIYGGKFSDGTQARDLRNWKQIHREWRETDRQRQEAGYGKSRMGGWVEP